MSTPPPQRKGLRRHVGSLLYGYTRLYCYTVVLSVLWLCEHTAPFVRPALTWLAVLGTLLSLNFELVERVPNFPFWKSMGPWIVCGVIVAIGRISDRAMKE